MYPEAKSVGRWLAAGWHVPLAYLLGFFVLLAVMGWHPTDKRGKALSELQGSAMQYVQLDRDQDDVSHREVVLRCVRAQG